MATQVYTVPTYQLHDLNSLSALSPTVNTCMEITLYQMRLNWVNETTVFLTAEDRLAYKQNIYIALWTEKKKKKSIIHDALMPSLVERELNQLEETLQRAQSFQERQHIHPFQ